MRAPIAALVASLWMAWGCDLESGLAPAPTASCAEAGAQCALVGGALGVCEQLSCKAGEQPPCFKCVSQH